MKDHPKPLHDLMERKKAIDNFWLLTLLALHTLMGTLWYSGLIIFPFLSLLKWNLALTALYVALQFFIEKIEIGKDTVLPLIRLSLLVMLVQITISVHFLGGTGAFILYPLYFVPIVASGILFSGWYPFATAFVSTTCISVLAVLESPELSQYLLNLGFPAAPLEILRRVPVSQYHLFRFVLPPDVVAVELLASFFVFLAFATMTKFLDLFYSLTRSMKKDIKGIESLFKFSLFNAPTGFVVGYRHDYTMAYFNRTVMDAFGLREVERRNVFSALSFDPEVAGFLKKKMEEGKPIDLKVASMVLKDGSKTFFQIRLSYVNYPTPAGEEGLFVLTLNNVTEELQLANIITHFGDAVILMEDSGRINLFNRSAAAVMPHIVKGTTLDEALNKAVSFSQDIISGILKGESLDGKVRIGDRTFLFSSSTVRDVTGIRLGILFTLKDVTNEEIFYNLSIKDELTGLHNRRYFMDLLERELVQAERYDKNFSLVFLDIDFFKKVNDTYGHHAGDVVLREFAGMIGKGVRKTDVAARMGGEEFAVFMPFVNKEGAHAICERLRESVERHRVNCEGTSIAITCSMGISEYRTGLDLKSLFEEADEALYEAKRTGRNRVLLSEK